MSNSFINYFSSEVAFIRTIPGSVGAGDTSMAIVLGAGGLLKVSPGTVPGTVGTYWE